MVSGFLLSEPLKRFKVIYQQGVCHYREVFLETVYEADIKQFCPRKKEEKCLFLEKPL
jgi:hypothetical protein